MIKFYDTCSLLNLQEKAFEDYFYISNITLIELENIKFSATRDEEIKWTARKLLHLLNQNHNGYRILCYHTKLDDIIKQFGLVFNDDSRIIVQVYQCYQLNSQIEFFTADLACKEIARSLGVPAHYTEEDSGDDYCGFIIKEMDDNDLATFYNDIIVNNKNIYELKYNQYILIKYNNKIIDKYKWLAGDRYEKINFLTSQSKMFGKITPKDEYQQIALDSLANNQITMLRGPAGTGKSYLAFGYMFQLLEQNKIDKIIIFCNTVATKGSAKLGFYPGSRTEKLLDSQIGNLLESKLGSRSEVERLIDEGQLVLLPMSDIRGYDTTGMNAAIYISEAQNLDIELMRLALQRIGDDSICILDGDSEAQVDLSMYAGTKNGMKRVSTVFRGSEIYGEVTLQIIYRSQIANLAQKL